MAQLLRKEFRSKNTATGTDHEAPYRSTILGRMRQMKAESFINLWDEIELVNGFSFFDYMSNQNLEDIIYNEHELGVVPVLGSHVRLRNGYSSQFIASSRWGVKLPFTIPLPIHIQSRYAAGTSLELEDLPF